MNTLQALKPAHTIGPWKAVHERVCQELDMAEIAEVSHIPGALKQARTAIARATGAEA